MHDRDTFLDTIISSAAAQYVHSANNEEENAALQQISPLGKQRIRALIRYSSKKTHTSTRRIRVLLMASVLSIFLFLAACTSMPSINRIIWHPVMEWYSDHISITFQQSEESTTDGAGESISDSSSEAQFPKRIETVNAPSYTPAGYKWAESHDIVFYSRNYFSENGKWVFLFTQELISTNKMLEDNEDGVTTTVLVHNIEAVLVSYSEGMYDLYWRDNQYTYTLHGYFDSYEELLKIAESVPPL